MLPQFHRTLLTSLLALGLSASAASAQLSSYATSVVDVVGSTGSAAVALGVPDYEFVNNSAVGFGSNTDVFDVGESAVFSFPVPMRAIAAQHDAIISAFVGGLGATDNANVHVEASSDGVNFVSLGNFETSTARSRGQDGPENNHEGVKHFYIEFGAQDFVTHLRLTNTAGTPEGFYLDAVEGLLPENNATHAFEIRFERHREEFARRFAIRIKNTATAGAVPIREIRINNSVVPGTNLEETQQSIIGADGEFFCVENCVPDNGTYIPYSRHIWSVDGTTEAPAGVGLESGRSATHLKYRPFDTDSAQDLLVGFSFEITFADGFVHTFTYDDDALINIGNLYQKYLYFSATPVQSWPLPVSYYEFASSGAPEQVPGLTGPLPFVALFSAMMLGAWLVRARSEEMA